MAFVTLVTRYPGTCGRCRLPIPVGTSVRYGGRGRVWHLAAACPGSTTNEGERRERAYNAHRTPDAFARQQAGERAMEMAMDRAYAGETD